MQCASLRSRGGSYLPVSMEERAPATGLRRPCTRRTLAITSAAALCIAALWNWGPAGPIEVSALRLVGGPGVAAQSVGADTAAPQPAKASKHAVPAPLQGMAAALEGMAACDSFTCLRKERRGLPEPTRFSFPHLFIVGFAKSATTSLAGYLKRHPEVMMPRVRQSPWFPRLGMKESHFFDKGCVPKPSRTRCDPALESYYIRRVLKLPDAAKAGFNLATFEATPTYVKHEFKHVDQSLATYLRKEIPWLRVVISIREPVSHAISWCGHINHIIENTEMVDCLWYRFKRAGNSSRFHSNMLTEYSKPVSGWLEEFPAEQLHVIQYERLTDDTQQLDSLHNFTAFLGLSESSNLLNEQNVRKTDDKCWLMKKKDYAVFANAARADAVRLVAMLTKKGLADASTWMAAWERVWEDQLSTCNADDLCCLVPS